MQPKFFLNTTIQRKKILQYNLIGIASKIKKK